MYTDIDIDNTGNLHIVKCEKKFILAMIQNIDVSRITRYNKYSNWVIHIFNWFYAI